MEFDCTFYCSPEEDTRKFIEDAIEAFSNQHIGFPDVVYIELWRRMTELPNKEWTEIRHGVVSILIRTPFDNDIPLQFESIDLRKDTAICARKRVVIPAPASNAPVPVIAATTPQ